MTDWIESVLEAAERSLRKAGVDRWEICADEAVSAGAEAKDGDLDVIERSIERTFGVRVLDGGIGFSGRTEPSVEGIDAAVREAIAEARRSRPATIGEFAPPDLGSGVGTAAPALDPSRSAPGQSGIAGRIECGTLDLLDPRATAGVRPELGQTALELEAKTLAVDHRIARVRPARIDEEIARFAIRTSLGLDRAESRSRALAMVGAVAESEDDARSSYASTSSSSIEGIDLRALAEDAALAASSLLGAGAYRTARVPVIFSPEATAELAQLLIHALAADRVERGASFLAGKLGDRVLSSELSLIDDPRDPDLDGACAFDGEGLTTFALCLIDQGSVAAYLDDRESAARAGRAPNARAVRAAGARGVPTPGAHTIVLRPGSDSLPDLYARSEGGLYVHELSGTHTVNEVTGELSLGATGWVVRGRSRAEPVEGATVSGTLLSMLSGPMALSLESKRLGGVRSPWLWLESAQVAG
jgi:PmbA protein